MSVHSPGRFDQPEVRLRLQVMVPGGALNPENKKEIDKKILKRIVSLFKPHTTMVWWTSLAVFVGVLLYEVADNLVMMLGVELG